MRLIWLLSALAAVTTAGKGIPPIDATTRQNFLKIFKESSGDSEKIEKLVKELTALPGNACRKDMAILVRLSHFYYNDTTESDILLRSFDSFIDYAIQQKSIAEVATLQRNEWSTVVGENLYNQQRAELHRIRTEEFPEIYNEVFGKCPAQKMVYEYIRDIFKYQEYNGKDEVGNILDSIVSSNVSYYEKREQIVDALGDCKEAYECADQILANENNTNIGCAFGALVSCATENYTEIDPEHSAYSRSVYILKIQLDQLFLEDPYVQSAYNNFKQFFFQELAGQLLEHGKFVDAMPLVKKHVTKECETQFNGLGEFEYCTQVRKIHSTFLRIYRVITMFWSEYDKIHEQLRDGSIDAVVENEVVNRYLGDMLHSSKTIFNVELFFDLIESLRELHSVSNVSSTVSCYIKGYSKAAILTIHSILPPTVRAQLARDLQSCPDVLTLENTIDWAPTTTAVPVTSVSSSTEAPLPGRKWCDIVKENLVKIARLINDKEMKPCDKLVKAVELGLKPGTQHYEAFKYLIQLRDLFQAGIFHPNTFSTLSTYNRLIFDKLQQAYLHNKTCESENCLAVKDPSQFELSDADREALIKIEDAVNNAIYAEAELPKQVFAIAGNNNTGVNERVEQITVLLNVTGSELEKTALAKTYVLALKYKDLLVREMGEKETKALLKHLELVIAGSIRGGAILPLDMEQFGPILELLKNAHHYEALLIVLKDMISTKLSFAGLNSELQEFIIQQLPQLTLEQLESIYDALDQFGICPTVPQLTTPTPTTTTTATTPNNITQSQPTPCNCPAPQPYPYPPIYWPYPMPYPPSTYPFPTRVTTIEYGYPYPLVSGQYSESFPYASRQAYDGKTRRSVNSKENSKFIKAVMNRRKRQTVQEYYADINKDIQ